MTNWSHANQWIKATLLPHGTCPYVNTVNGQGMLIDARREIDPFSSGAKRGERLRYQIGVRLLSDGVERFYLPGTLWEVEQKAIG